MIRQELYKNMDCCGGVYPLSVVQGYQQGSVTEFDKSTLIWHWCGFAFVFGEPAEKDIDSIFDMMQKAKSDGRRLVLFSEKKSLTDAFARRGVNAEKRYFYEFSKDRANDVMLPDGFEIKAIDAENIERLDGRIKPSFSWERSERFLEKGKGFCVMDGQTPAAWAFSAAVSDSEVDIGVETLDSYRGKGLAAAAAKAMIRYVLLVGKKAVWACHYGNIGSQKVAKKLGFEPSGECMTITLSR